MTSIVRRHSILLLGTSIAVLTYIFLIGCGGIRESRLPKASDSDKEDSYLTISEEDSKVYVPPEVKDLFKENLNNLLIEKGKFKRGTGLNIVYSYVQFNPGNQSAHHLISGGMGEGSITFNVKYIDNSGNELSNIQISGKISLGYPINVAIEDCARQITSYTEENFLTRRTEMLVDDVGKEQKGQEKEVNIIDRRDKMKGWWEPAR